MPFNVKLPVDKLVKVPTDVILGWLAVWIVPVKLVADKFRILDISLLESTINALLASAVPNVVIVVYSFVLLLPELKFGILLISAAVTVIKVPFNVKLPVDKLVKVPTDVILGWLAVWSVPVIVAAFEAPIEVTPDKVVILGWLAVNKVPVIVAAFEAPIEVTPAKVVILGWLAVNKVPVKLVADKFRILDISLFESTIKALLASAVPNVVIVVYWFVLLPELILDVPLTVKFPVIVTFPPTFILLATPNPPATVKAPVLVLLELAVDKTFNLLVAKSA